MMDRIPSLLSANGERSDLEALIDVAQFGVMIARIGRLEEDLKKQMEELKAVKEQGVPQSGIRPADEDILSDALKEFVKSQIQDTVLVLK